MKPLYVAILSGLFVLCGAWLISINKSEAGMLLLTAGTAGVIKEVHGAHQRSIENTKRVKKAEEDAQEALNTTQSLRVELARREKRPSNGE